VAYTKADRAAFLPWNQRRGIDERARSPCRLLEQSTEAAHGFHPVRSIDPQPVHDWGQVIRNRPALVRAKFSPRPIQQHDIVLDLDRQKPLVRRPHMQTPQRPDWGGDARRWTGISGRLAATGCIRDGDRYWPGL
jgi:hypothetical protein